MNADYDNFNDSFFPLYGARQSSENNVFFDVREVLLRVLYDNFKYGINIESFIELERLRGFVNKLTGHRLELSDDAIKNEILSIGHQFEGKVYIVRNETKNHIIKTVNDVFASGNSIIFYNVLYDTNNSWLFSESIVSDEMFKDILKNLFPFMLFYRNYFTNNKTLNNEHFGIESEIMRVWGDDTLLSYGQIKERLPYIPFDKIMLVLSLDNGFIWNCTETYTHVSLLDINESESLDIKNIASKLCSEKGYATFNDLPLDSIIERNYDLTLTAIHVAVYKACLDSDFDRKCKIIVLKGVNIDASDILRDYCKSIDRCSFDSLLAFEKDLTGERHRVLEAACSELVRIDENVFVADKYVCFNVDATDKVLKEFVIDEYLPLKSFTTFAIFPNCGQRWNLYLLESYCRRFSKIFYFESLSANSRNAGVVIKKGCKMDYEDIMLDAIIKSNISLNQATILDFLRAKGFIGRRSYARLNVLIDRLSNK